jgi:branched-subunit amino acid ABC-type transport system permease component
VSPQTGPLAGFGEADTFVLAGVRKAFGKGLRVGDATHPVEVLVRDSQSDPNRAAEVASRLILSDKVDLMLVASTPETTNPVSDQCEVNGTPCISTVAPWQPWFWLALVIGAGAILHSYLHLRSRFGLALTAIRDSEPASESLGIDVFRTKLAVYVLASFGAGLTGALIYLNLLRISPDAAFTVNWTAFMIFIVVIGGIGTIEGPIVGTLVFFLLREFLADYGSWYLILLGLVAVAVVLRYPQGLWGLIADRWDVRFFPVQRRVRFAEGPHRRSTLA